MSMRNFPLMQWVKLWVVVEFAHKAAENNNLIPRAFSLAWGGAGKGFSHPGEKALGTRLGEQGHSQVTQNVMTAQ